MKSQQVIVIAGIAILFVVILISSSSRKPRAPSGPLLPAPAGWEGEVARLTNAERSSRGLTQLSFDDKLSDIARKHSEDMIRRNFFDHKNPDGDYPSDRARKAGFSFNMMGENIAAGQPDTGSVMSAWMKSTGHRQNILMKNYRKIGVGIARTSQGQPYWTQVFAG
jgi:uncharacterized protein YkwD